MMDRMIFSSADAGGTTASALRQLAWVHLPAADPDEVSADSLHTVQRELGLAEPLLDELQRAGARAGIHEHGSNLVVVLRLATWSPKERALRFRTVHAVLGAGFVLTIGDTATVAEARRTLAGRPELVESGSAAALPCLLTPATDGYGVAVAALADEVDDIESALFDGPPVRPTARIHQLFRQVLDLRRAMAPLAAASDELSGMAAHAKLRDNYRRDRRRLIHLMDEVETLTTALTNALQVDLTQLSVAQNDDMRRISAWVAIWAVPTLVAGVYGMNFDHMPELAWPLGYPLALLLMAALGGLVHRGFRRSGWL